MRLSIHQLNIQHLQKVLGQTGDCAKRAQILKLLAEEEAKIKMLRARKASSVEPAGPSSLS